MDATLQPACQGRVDRTPRRLPVRCAEVSQPISRLAVRKEEPQTIPRSYKLPAGRFDLGPQRARVSGVPRQLSRGSLGGWMA
jgi:hypothetical protein